MLALWLTTTTVRAQPSVDDVEEHSEQEKETARALYRLGNERYASGDYRGALEAFLGAHRIMGAPTTGLGLGKAQEKTGKLLEAQQTLRRVAESRASADDPESFSTAREEAAQLVVDLSARIPKLELRVTGDGGPLRGLEVSIDGRPLSNHALSEPQALDPGVHIVQLNAPGYVSSAKSVELAERENQLLHVVLAKIPPPPPAPLPTPPSPATATQPKPPAPPTAPRVGLPLAVAGLSVGGVGLVAGAITGGISLSAAAKLEDECDAEKVCPPSAEADRDRSLTTAHISTASFAVAGVGIAVGIVGLVLDAPYGSDSALRLELGPGFVGLRGEL